MTTTVKDHTLTQLTLFLAELEHQLRSERKYGKSESISWVELSDRYHALKADYMHVDLVQLLEDLDTNHG